MCFNNPKICKLALSRIFRENYRRIICNSQVQFSDKDLYLSFVEMTKTVWGQFSRLAGILETRLSRESCASAKLKLSSYADCTNIQIQIDKYNYANTNTQIQIQKHEGVMYLCQTQFSSYADCTNLHQGVDLSSFNLVRKCDTKEYITTKKYLPLFFCAVIVIGDMPDI